MTLEKAGQIFGCIVQGVLIAAVFYFYYLFCIGHGRWLDDIERMEREYGEQLMREGYTYE